MRDKIIFDLGSGDPIPMLLFYTEWVYINGVYRPFTRIKLPNGFRP